MLEIGPLLVVHALVSAVLVPVQAHMALCIPPPFYNPFPFNIDETTHSSAALFSRPLTPTNHFSISADKERQKKIKKKKRDTGIDLR